MFYKTGKPSGTSGRTNKTGILGTLFIPMETKTAYDILFNNS